MEIHIDEHSDESHQICGILWADNYWVILRSQEHLKHMMKDLIEEAERWDGTWNRDLQACCGQAQTLMRSR